MAHFTIEELCYSDTAKKLKIDNTPSEEIKQHLEVMIAVLEEIRALWGKPIRVSSGYRCPVLNRKVGGSPTSAHRIGYAVDILPTGVGEFYALVSCVEKWANNHMFDQILIERNSSGAKWLHIGLFSCTGAQRRQIMHMSVV